MTKKKSLYKSCHTRPEAKQTCGKVFIKKRGQPGKYTVWYSCVNEISGPSGNNVQVFR